MGEDGKRVVATNRKARHEYEVLESFEAGMVLRGPEVKSVRQGHVAFRDAFARIEGGEVLLDNLHIRPYEQANRENADPIRTLVALVNRVVAYVSSLRRGKPGEKHMVLEVGSRLGRYDVTTLTQSTNQ